MPVPAHCDIVRPRKASVSGMADEHWLNFPYAATARHWHALWARYLPDGTLTQTFHAERIFRPLRDEEGTEMHVIYHYTDERGTVASGPQSGPWRITKAGHNSFDGLRHPSQSAMVTLHPVPGGPSGWCAKTSLIGKEPCAAELFLHHGHHLRMSAGIVHGVDGSLKQLSLIREDDRGPWPSAGWSMSTEVKVTDGAEGLQELQVALANAGMETPYGQGRIMSACLQQAELRDIPLSGTRLMRVDRSDALLLGPDSVAIVAPRQRVTGAPFSCAAAWWPEVPGEAAATLYLIEARWDGDGALESVSYLNFTQFRGVTKNAATR